MKKYIAIISLLISSFSYAQEEKIKIVTSFTIIADIAQNIAKDHAIVESITKAGAEIHQYQPTPKDIIRAQKADLILWNGFNLELWFKQFLQDVKNVPSVIVTETIEPLSIYEGEYTGKPNPHAWMSIENGLIYIENIRKALVDIDPKNAESYNKNAKDYSQKLIDLKNELHDAFSHIPENQRYLVTSEGAFSYLARDIGFQEIYIWPVNADQQGSSQQMRKVIDIVKEKQIPVVFSESTISDKPAKQVAKETSARYGGVLYVDSLSKAKGPVPTYLDLLTVTTKTIATAFE